MRKIIKGKVYDTYTAKSCGEYWNGYSAGDFNNITEELFLKKTGEFFLHCYGGPMTKYGEWHGNIKTNGEKIKPLTYKEAREWAEKMLKAEEYESIFGDLSEDDEGEVGIHVAIPKTLYDKVGRERLQNGRQMKDVVIEALEKYLFKEVMENN